jgi:hypothetical protein
MKASLLVALALMGASTAAQASQERPRGQVDAVVRCLDIAGPQERLACFDAAATVLRRDVQSGAVSFYDSENRPRLEYPMSASVTGASSNQNGQWLVTLDNGQVWETENRQRSSQRPASGTAVQIQRGLLGTGLWLRLPNGNRYKVRLVG